jgi:hypothetical protein
MEIFMLPWYDHERYAGLGPNSVGKLNVSVQSVKHKNSKGVATRGNYEIWFLILIHSITLL